MERMAYVETLEDLQVAISLLHYKYIMRMMKQCSKK